MKLFSIDFYQDQVSTIFLDLSDKYSSGQNWRNFCLVTKILSDDIFCQTKNFVRKKKFALQIFVQIAHYSYNHKLSFTIVAYVTVGFHLRFRNFFKI